MSEKPLSRSSADLISDEALSLNQPLGRLPDECEVLVIGAGPAGSAAARVLAQAGIDVILIDQHSFPRDKVCGDGLIPDAHHALHRLGLLDEVMSAAQKTAHVRCIAPRGGSVDVPGSFAVLPRKQLDYILCRASVQAGVQMFAPLRMSQVIEENGKVIGALLKQGSETRTLKAKWVILASGAMTQGITASGVIKRTAPSGVALRGYILNPAMTDRIDKLEVAWHRALSPGYGWIFPYKDGVFNIGVGLMYNHDKQKKGNTTQQREVNLQKVFDRFVQVYTPARELMEGGTWVQPLKGAPLRCTLEGAHYSRPGLLVAGEAAGSTYSFTGEGVGKALETGMLAAEALITGLQNELSDSALQELYEGSLRRLKPHFDLYAQANRINRFPWLVDLLAWRGRTNKKFLKKLSGIIDETVNPGELVTVKGVVKMFVETK